MRLSDRQSDKVRTLDGRQSRHGVAIQLRTCLKGARRATFRLSAVLRQSHPRGRSATFSANVQVCVAVRISSLADSEIQVSDPDEKDTGELV